MGSLTSTLTVSLKDDVSAKALKVSTALKNAGKQVEAISKAGFSDRLSGQLSQLGLRAKDIDKVSAAWKQYATAQGLAGKSSDWTKSQAAQVRSWERATVASLRNVSRERRQFEAQQQRAASIATSKQKSPNGLVETGTGLLTGYGAKRFVQKSIGGAAEFDIAARQQQGFAGISEAEQKERLIPQAKRIGQDTQFSNVDIIKAQTAILTRLPEQLPRAAVAQGITEEVKNYALSMKADMETSAENITAYLMQTGKDISTHGKAIAEARKASNMLIRMAKLSGMTDEDTSQFMKYSATSSTLAGLSPEMLGALGVGLKRAGFRGDEAGVGIRSISSKLVSPGRKGLDAMTAMGVDYNKFTNMPGGLSAENLEAMQKRRFGKTFTDSQRDRLDDLMEDPQVLENKDEFVAKVSAIMAESFDKSKKGKTKAQDAQKIAKLAADFHQLGVASVNSEALLEAILSANPTLQQLNALFTDKQGGKAGALGKALQQVLKDREALQNTPDDFGKKIADLIMGGLGGALERAKGSVENFNLAIGQANEKLAMLSLDKFGNALDAISNLPDPVKRFTSEIGLAAAAIAGLKGFEALTGGFGLKGSAVALDGSAAAITAAASRLGGSIPGAPSNGSSGSPGAPGAPAGAKPSAWNLLAPLSIYLGGREVIDSIFDALPQPKYPPGYDPKAELNKTTFDRIENLLRPGLSKPGGKTNFSPWVANSANSIWEKGTDPIEGLDQADKTGAYGTKNGEAYKAQFNAALQGVDAMIDAAMARWSAKLGSFSASPSITPKFGPAPSLGKQTGLDPSSKFSNFSDGSSSNFGIG